MAKWRREVGADRTKAVLYWVNNLDESIGRVVDLSGERPTGKEAVHPNIVDKTNRMVYSKRRTIPNFEGI